MVENQYSLSIKKALSYYDWYFFFLFGQVDYSFSSRHLINDIFFHSSLTTSYVLSWIALFDNKDQLKIQVYQIEFCSMFYLNFHKKSPDKLNISFNLNVSKKLKLETFQNAVDTLWFSINISSALLRGEFIWRISYMRGFSKNKLR